MGNCGHIDLQKSKIAKFRISERPDTNKRDNVQQNTNNIVNVSNQMKLDEMSRKSL